MDKIHWNDQMIADFLNGVKTGKIITDSSGNTQDSKGPLTYFLFKEYNCEIHVHWIDAEREKMSVAHLKDTSTGEIITTNVDTYTVSMLRHFSGLDKKQGFDENKAKKQNKKLFKVLVIIIPIIFILAFLLIPRKNCESKGHNFEPYYTTTQIGFSSNSSRDKSECLALHKTPEKITAFIYCNSPESHIRKLSIGRRIKVLKIENYAAYIELEDGQRGWIHYVYVGVPKEKK
jgi:hypothetical protein